MMTSRVCEEPKTPSIATRSLQQSSGWQTPLMWAPGSALRRRFGAEGTEQSAAKFQLLSR